MDTCWLLKGLRGSWGDDVGWSDVIPENRISWLPVNGWEMDVGELVDSGEAVWSVLSRAWLFVALPDGWRDHAFLGGGGAVG